MEELTFQMIETIVDAASKLTGSKRRSFQARVSLDYLCGETRLTERVFGWSRHTVARGLEELRRGEAIPDAPRSCRPKTEVAKPALAADLMELVEPHSQTDPKFQGLFKYTRITAKAAHQMLITQKNYTAQELPHPNTIGVMLNRLGYKMRRVAKAKPKKNSSDRCYLC